jgi:hypothetical protein
MIPKNPQKITINCSNDTQARKQKGINPKCPTGFKETFDIGKPL